MNSIHSFFFSIKNIFPLIERNPNLEISRYFLETIISREEHCFEDIFNELKWRPEIKESHDPCLGFPSAAVVF